MCKSITGLAEDDARHVAEYLLDQARAGTLVVAQAENDLAKYISKANVTALNAFVVELIASSGAEVRCALGNNIQ